LIGKVIAFRATAKSRSRKCHWILIEKGEIDKSGLNPVMMF
jgi:hypothetical protein